MATLDALSALALARPAPDAPVLVVADWYERKARLLREIAAASPADQATFEPLAELAQKHAAQLLDPYPLTSLTSRSA